MLSIIRTPEDLVGITNEICHSDHELILFEAKIILGYLEGSDYSLLYRYSTSGEQYFVIHDNQDLDEDSGEKCYSIKPIIEEASQLCYDILVNARTDDTVHQDYIDVLERDEYILDRLADDY